MELWTCASCGSKNAGEACWKCQAHRPPTAVAPGTPSAPAAAAPGSWDPPTPPSPPAAPVVPGAWDPASAVPRRPVAPSWTSPISPSQPPPYAPSASPAVPPVAAGSTSRPAWSVPATSPGSGAAGSSSWSAPVTGAGASPAATSASPPPAATGSGAGIPKVRILVLAAIILVVLLVVLIVGLSRHASALSTPASAGGLPPLQGSHSVRPAEQTLRAVVPAGRGALVGVGGRDAPTVGREG